VLRGDWLTQGPEVAAFEEALAEAVGARYAVVVSNGTAALHAAYFAARLGPGAELLTSPITFAATSNAALQLGAGVAFADVDPASALVDMDALAAKLSPATRVIAPVHFAGQPCDVEAVRALADRQGTLVVEDAAHALGAEYFDAAAGEWVRVGSCRHGHMAIFSFHPAKHVAMGEGGAITTNDPELDRRLRMFRDHGIAREPEQLERNDEGPWYYEMHALGINARVTDFQCALGRSQLARLPAFVERRRAIAARYDGAFAGCDLLSPLGQRDTARSSYHLYVVQLALQKLSRGRREIVQALREKGIGAHVHYVPVHTHPYYRKDLGFRPGQFPNAERYYERALTLPLFPAMSDRDVERVIRAVFSTLEADSG
jgi:UDP-4-amino-4,6-dideoxy-N-acetyl-beta-L-altrosamine transaminase